MFLRLQFHVVKWIFCSWWFLGSSSCVNEAFQKKYWSWNLEKKNRIYRKLFRNKKMFRNFQSIFRYFGKSSKRDKIAKSWKKSAFRTFVSVFKQSSNKNHCNGEEIFAADVFQKTHCALKNSPLKSLFLAFDCMLYHFWSTTLVCFWHDCTTRLKYVGFLKRKPFEKIEPICGESIPTGNNSLAFYTLKVETKHWVSESIKQSCLVWFKISQNSTISCSRFR